MRLVLSIIFFVLERLTCYAYKQLYIKHLMYDVSGIVR